MKRRFIDVSMRYIKLLKKSKERPEKILRDSC